MKFPGTNERDDARQVFDASWFVRVHQFVVIRNLVELLYDVFIIEQLPRNGTGEQFFQVVGITHALVSMRRQEVDLGETELRSKIARLLP